MRKFLSIATVLVATTLSFSVNSQSVQQTKGSFEDKFRQLEEVLPTPNVYRTGSGAPGHKYWQQKVDYKINVEIDDNRQWLTGSEDITYTNNSPDPLNYLWVQMDQNRFASHSDGFLTGTTGDKSSMGYGTLRRIMMQQDGDHGYNITAVKDGRGNDVFHHIIDTYMRIDMAQPLKPGGVYKFTIDWNHHIIDGKALGGRGGYEFFEKDSNYIYEISQWFPRLAVYSDTNGWNTKGFLGSGEFTLEFGDYDVSITVPSDHIVGSTGVLQNPRDVLTPTQRARLKEAETANDPVMIVTGEEALENEKEAATDTKTWRFKAENVRDFAFATSRKFVWDAQGVKLSETHDPIMAMSYYPEEAMPLWDKYSTRAIVHTVKTYSKYTFDYPYPVSLSINGPQGGMEYPMITFNGPRPVIDKEDGHRTYTKRAKYGLIGVVIHEVGHNWFPMIVDSDERNWTWMDEGLNSYLQNVTEREWEKDYPVRRANPADLISYMLSTNQVPIMTQSDSILQFGNNAYGKPAAALNLLRETIVGREAFDFAFKEYSRRWMFKHPFPADFFRSIEDASGMDLDWFWRGWFYTTDHVDLSIETVTWAKIDSQDPDIEEPLKRAKNAEDRVWPGFTSGDDTVRMIDLYPSLNDFYNENDDYTVTGKMRKKHESMLKGLDGWEKELLTLGSNIYFIDFKNIGGLVMPILLDIEFTDGSHDNMRISAEIWRKNAKSVTKAIVSEKEIASISMDPMRETADADKSNNHWPRKAIETKLQLFKRSATPNLMEDVYQDEHPKEDKKEDGGK